MVERDQVIKLVRWHIEQHSALGITDVYKLLYQGVLGAEHLMQDEKKAQTYLAKEWEAVPGDQNILLLEPVSVDGHVVRLNIARAKSNGISQHQVWLAFYRSVQNLSPSKTAFEQVWNLFQQSCEENLLPFDLQDVHYFTQNVRSEGFPAKHHSEAYRKANRPAYRVLSKQQFEHMMRMA